MHVQYVREEACTGNGCLHAPNLVTSTQTRSSPSPSMAARIGRAAVPPGSPSSAPRASPATRYAQQLCEAPGSLAVATRDSACGQGSC